MGIISQRQERALQTQYKRIAALEAESEGRRKVLFEKAEELSSEWRRAEEAEAERDRLQEAAKHAVKCRYTGSGLCWKCAGRLQSALAEPEGK